MQHLHASSIPDPPTLCLHIGPFVEVIHLSFALCLIYPTSRHSASHLSRVSSVPCLICSASHLFHVSSVLYFLLSYSSDQTQNSTYSLMRFSLDLLRVYHNLQLGYHTTRWKRARGILLEKGGKRDFGLVRSYRVISLVNCIGKVVEKVVAKELSRNFEDYSKLYPG